MLIEKTDESDLFYFTCIMYVGTHEKNRALKGNKIVQVILKPHAVYGILIFMTSLVHGVLQVRRLE